ncbi:hypothetical protein Pyn_18873 [Prunus yedoensis var. nudiflora]|uniref:Uncharacterized protein n=1 Tax=Prunus yedoensis var. nudiflora TaxID=2094558 RepID=A0A314XFL3_PRUYE|nr:hypothetical protein Pyn_18873 [Prunus yedoensis var. nudiflora]
MCFGAGPLKLWQDPKARPLKLRQDLGLGLEGFDLRQVSKIWMRARKTHDTTLAVQQGVESFGLGPWASAREDFKAFRRKLGLA